MASSLTALPFKFASVSVGDGAGATSPFQFKFEPTKFETSTAFQDFRDKSSEDSDKRAIDNPLERARFIRKATQKVHQKCVKKALREINDTLDATKDQSIQRIIDDVLSGRLKREHEPEPLKERPQVHVPRKRAVKVEDEDAARKKAKDEGLKPAQIQTETEKLTYEAHLGPEADARKAFDETLQMQKIQEEFEQFMRARRPLPSAPQVRLSQKTSSYIA